MPATAPSGRVITPRRRWGWGRIQSDPEEFVPHSHVDSVFRAVTGTCLCVVTQLQTDKRVMKTSQSGDVVPERTSGFSS